MWGVSAAEAARAITMVMTGHDPDVEPGCPYCGTAAHRDGHGFCVACGAPPVLARRPSRVTETIHADALSYYPVYGAPDQ